MSDAAGPPPTMTARRRGCGNTRSSAIRQAASVDAVQEDVDDEDRPGEGVRLRQKVDGGEGRELEEEGRQEEAPERLAESLVVAVQAEERKTGDLDDGHDRDVSEGEEHGAGGKEPFGARDRHVRPEEEGGVEHAGRNRQVARESDGPEQRHAAARHQDRAVRLQTGRA